MIDPNGVVLTNQHVIDGMGTVVVELPDGRRLTASIKAQSTSSDLAVLAIEAAKLDYISLASAQDVALGTEVFTVGYPATEILGDSLKLTTGVINAQSGIGDEASLMQTTVPLQLGNSGGPLVNETGDVIGIVTSTAAVANFLRLTGSLPQNVN